MQEFIDRFIEPLIVIGVFILVWATIAFLIFLFIYSIGLIKG